MREGTITANAVSPDGGMPKVCVVTAGRSDGMAAVVMSGPLIIAESPDAPQILAVVVYVVAGSNPSTSTTSGHPEAAVRGVAPESPDAR